MNKHKLINPKNYNSDEAVESHMEKYLNMNYYDLKQDYLGVLRKSIIKEKYQGFLNDFFNKEIGGSKKSIREVKKIIENEHVISNFSKNQIFGLKSIIKIFSEHHNSDKIIVHISEY
jgi:hypothetical protein